ncbi:hypothetical protein NFHSH190041_05880 [Shewanella sp. NFH-SH190041]|nr:hypothetical protein NFHSH190041_05880 [Shewanella sp. NFH-SH190041]
MNARCVSEPILLSQNNNGLTISDNPAVNALGVSYFHWAINAWSIYCILALALAFLHFNTKKPLSVHSAFISDINQTGRFSIPTVVQVFTIIATVFGLVTSFGFAASQTGSGLNYIFSMLAIDSDIVELGVVGVIFIITCFSLARGVSRGMRRVSELNSILSIFILVCFILFGPLNYILNIFLESV